LSTPSAGGAHAHLPPSPWVQRFAALLPPRASVLDLACGAGRHTRWLALQRHQINAMDRDEAAVAPLSSLAEVIVADIEAGAWPLEGRSFGGVVVANYLWRPLWPKILQSVGGGGWLICETFAQGNETVGKPSNPDFLLRPGELLEVVRNELRVVAYEDGFLRGPDRFVQRIAAVREVPAAQPPRYAL
jgi:SAM-dependent methyltransferase